MKEENLMTDINTAAPEWITVKTIIITGDKKLKSRFSCCTDSWIESGARCQPLSCPLIVQKETVDLINQALAV